MLTVDRLLHVSPASRKSRKTRGAPIHRELVLDAVLWPCAGDAPAAP